jgi:NAD(P)-dependent dehydrogenase (short-subunit alcohol dehydrogenase family)
MSLAGKVYIVTGATGGLGPAVVAALLAAEARVAITARQAGAMQRLIEQAAVGDRLAGQVVDLTDEGAVRAFADWASERFGGLDGLVAVAGGFGGGTPIHETDLATWNGQLEINLLTTFLACKHTVPHLIRRGGGSIVTVGSRAGQTGTPGIAAYSVSKGGVARLTEALAAEVADQNVTVNCVLPSTIDTPANRAGSPDADYSRWVRPEAIANVIRWLLGPDARPISGAAIPVYGRA